MVASNTAVGINGITSGTDAADFSGDVFDAKTLFSLASSNSLTGTEGCEQFECFGVFVKTHDKSLSKKLAVKNKQLECIV
jgi:hypothetical protein